MFVLTLHHCHQTQLVIDVILNKLIVHVLQLLEYVDFLFGTKLFRYFLKVLNRGRTCPLLKVVVNEIVHCRQLSG